MKRIRLSVLLLTVLASPLALGTRSAAWDVQGHRIVCQIAFERLTPDARTLVKSIQGGIKDVRDPFDECANCKTAHFSDARAMSFQEGCVWADESRRDTFRDTYEYHFINVPTGSTSFSLVRDCAALDCAVVAIQRYARYVALPANDSSARERRLLALRFLSHFVGDLHQPLHVGFIEDRGGNLITVRWDPGMKQQPEQVSLHSVWDGKILARAGITDQFQDGIALNKQITQAELAAWQNFDIASWAAESFTHALSDAYFNAGRPIAVEQLKKAGVRLAHLINAAAAGTLPDNLLQLTP